MTTPKTIDLIHQKLQNAPEDVLEKVSVFIDQLLPKSKPFELSEKQKSFLLKQNEVPLSQCSDVEEVYQQLKQKYDRSSCHNS